MRRRGRRPKRGRPAVQPFGRGRGQRDLGNIQCLGPRPRRLAQPSVGKGHAGFVANLDPFSGQRACRRTLHPHPRRERSVHHDRRGDAPHGNACGMHARFNGSPGFTGFAGLMNARFNGSPGFTGFAGLMNARFNGSPGFTGFAGFMQRPGLHATPPFRAASLPAMRPKTRHRPRPCWANPPWDSPAQYRPGITWPCVSMTWAFAFVRKPVSES